MDNIMICTFLVIITLAIISDLRERRIPNVIILVGIFFAFINIILFNAPLPLGQYLLGFVLGIALLIVPFIFRGIGAGDVKLLGVIGLWLGTKDVLNVVIYSALIGGCWAILKLVGYRLHKYKNVKAVSSAFVNSVFTKNFISEDEKKIDVPYAVPLGVATVWVLFYGGLL